MYVQDNIVKKNMVCSAMALGASSGSCKRFNKLILYCKETTSSLYCKITLVASTAYLKTTSVEFDIVYSQIFFSL